MDIQYSTNSFFCCHSSDKKFTDFVKENYKDAVNYYNNIDKIRKGSILLGLNYNHHHALYLSKLPVVVFDYHTDMYDESDLGNGNWVYWKLKGVEDVHLVLPSTSNVMSSVSSSYMPKGSVDKLKVYTPKSNSPPLKIFEGSKPLYFEPNNMNELIENTCDLDKQISIDLDFNFGGNFSVLSKVFSSLKKCGDQYDIWIEPGEGVLETGEGVQYQIDNMTSILNLI